MSPSAPTPPPPEPWPRRPAGWQAPGPPPAGAQGDPELEPRTDEDLSYLLGDWRIFQRVDGHRWSADDFLTAWYATDRAPAGGVRTALDLGCGIGSVLMMVAWAFPAARCEGIEAQELSVGMARRSLRFNGADDRCTVRHGDLRDPSVLPADARFDLVTGTPPYFPVGTGSISDRPQRGPCRFELRGGIEAYCEAAARWLAPGGRFIVCETRFAAGRVGAAAHEAGLSVLSRCDVVPRENKQVLFSLYALARAEEGAAESEPTSLLIRTGRGLWSEPFCRVRDRMGLPPGTRT